MLSHELIPMIESHWRELSDTVIARIRRDHRLTHLAALADSELLDAGSTIAKSLGGWLSGMDTDFVEGYEQLGARRFAQSIPLHESVRALHVLKHELVEFVRDRSFPQTSVQLYAEEELEHRLNDFFDSLVYHLVHGYESALQKSYQPQPKVALAR